MQKQFIGAHVSIAGGIEKSFDRALEIGANCFQIFTRTNRSWKTELYSQKEKESFSAASARSGITTVIGHASYLINLASATAETRFKSEEFLISELIRSSSIGIKSLVLHPGSHGGDGEDIGIERLSAALSRVIAQTPEDCTISLETMAGQGSSLGSTLESLKKIVQAVADSRRVKFCIDTCHIFAAGYDLSSAEKFGAFIDVFDLSLGLSNLAVIHCNDSKSSFKSNVDRHANIGEGNIAKEVFVALMNDSRLAHIPKILETPEKDGIAQYKSEIDWLNFVVSNK
jgi:deoxyribonuclease-4